MGVLICLRELSAATRLPIAWLRCEARAGRLPCLRVGRRMRFDLASVMRALAERAATEHGGMASDPSQQRLPTSK